MKYARILGLKYYNARPLRYAPRKNKIATEAFEKLITGVKIFKK
jgi:hypothetical protein